ncbi:unnamed protein product [Arctogadus glacialis]
MLWNLQGTPVTRVTASDADDPVYGNSARLVYSILEGQPYFSIDPNSATIKIALHGMDREMREEYLVVIQAKDMGGHMGGLSGTTTVTVTLTDVNDNPPKFSKSLYEFVIPEDLPIGKAGGRVKANDRDIGENAKSTYNIIEGDERGMFQISTDGQTQEGILKLKKPLDFESKKAFTLKVEATNLRSEPGSGGPYRDTATVKVVVEDSDEPPVFTRPAYVLEVNENAPVNTVIGTVNARDPDTMGSLVRLWVIGLWAERRAPSRRRSASGVRVFSNYIPGAEMRRRRPRDYWANPSDQELFLQTTPEEAPGCGRAAGLLSLLREQQSHALGLAASEWII